MRCADLGTPQLQDLWLPNNRRPYLPSHYVWCGARVDGDIHGQIMIVDYILFYSRSTNLLLQTYCAFVSVILIIGQWFSIYALWAYGKMYKYFGTALHNKPLIKSPYSPRNHRVCLVTKLITSTIATSISVCLQLIISMYLFKNTECTPDAAIETIVLASWSENTIAALKIRVHHLRTCKSFLQGWPAREALTPVPCIALRNDFTMLRRKSGSLDVLLQDRGMSLRVIIPPMIAMDFTLSPAYKFIR